MKYAWVILIPILIIAFFPKIIGALIGTALAFAIIPGAKILVGVIIILAILAYLMRNDKRYVKRKSDDFTTKIKK